MKYTGTRYHPIATSSNDVSQIIQIDSAIDFNWELQSEFLAPEVQSTNLP